MRSFPSTSSHYSRNKQYLSPTLNISIMHKLYLEKCVKENKDSKYKVEYWTYSDVFSRKFNLSFGPPRSDTCSTCDSGEADVEHIEKYKFAFEMKSVDGLFSRNVQNAVPAYFFLLIHARFQVFYSKLLKCN